jgi:hypothetical protein
MTQEIIAMARDAGLRSAVLLHAWGKEDALCDSEIEELRQIERFAALVEKEAERKASFDRAELWLKRINDAVAEEREKWVDAVLLERDKCAKFVDHILKEGGGTYGDAIRARGQA